MSDISHDPESSIPLTAEDRKVLSQTDAEYHYHTWDDLKDIIARNNLSLLKRKPSDLRRYIRWAADIKAEYGSMTRFLCQERLKWEPLPSRDQEALGSMFSYRNPIPFKDPSDYRILENDWPYGMTPGIKHLVVWLKTPIPVLADDGDLTPESRQGIEDFVDQTFVQRLDAAGHDGANKVVWFKNWTQLQSVRSLEHIHVLARDVPEDVLLAWTS
ncbi:MAG: hypothetical protein M1837_001046 [Sclerophora amabilis]|nr:MAG: hypothetical protein M1837_001046 [Sclerophora amabilis]